MASTAILRKSETEDSKPTPGDCGRRRRRPARRRRRRRTRASTALELNNVAVTLLDRSDCEAAIDALRDAIDVLASPGAEEDAAGGGGGVSLLAQAEARLAWAMEQCKTEERGGKTAEECSAHADSGSGPFVCASPVRMRIPRSDACIPSLLGLLAVISYNFGLAHQLLGTRLGCEILTNKATQFYKKSEAVVLSIVDSDDDPRVHFPAGFNVTFLARAIVNNMGLILFEWGEPDAGREFFDGLSTVSVKGSEGGYEESEAEERQEEKGRNNRWHAFVVNALIAKGVVSSSAA